MGLCYGGSSAEIGKWCILFAAKQLWRYNICRNLVEWPTSVPIVANRNVCTTWGTGRFSWEKMPIFLSPGPKKLQHVFEELGVNVELFPTWKAHDGKNLCLVRDIMDEAITTANAQSLLKPIPLTLPEKMVASSFKLGQNKPLILIDRLEGRPLELGALLVFRFG
jgi:hypothetical protein